MINHLPSHCSSRPTAKATARKRHIRSLSLSHHDRRSLAFFPGTNLSRLGPTLRSLRYPASLSSSLPLPNLDRRAFTGAGGPPGPLPLCRRDRQGETRSIRGCKEQQNGGGGKQKHSRSPLGNVCMLGLEGRRDIWVTKDCYGAHLGLWRIDTCGTHTYMRAAYIARPGVCGTVRGLQPHDRSVTNEHTCCLLYIRQYSSVCGCVCVCLHSKPIFLL